MSIESNSQYRVLRELLATWKLSELFEHFKDEGINIEEMQLMRQHHVTELLQNHKLGVRVRFEYYFEIWRRNINKPLGQCRSKCPSCCHQSGQTSLNLQSIATTSHFEPIIPVPTTVRPLKSRGTNTLSIELSDAETNTSRSPTTTPTLSSPLPTQLLPEILPELPKLTPQPKHLVNGQSGVHNGPPTTPTSVLCSIPKSNTSAAILDSENNSLPSNLADAQCNGHISLLQILKSSGPRGAALMQHYEEHQEFTNAHRALLISIIVNFFDENDFHLSLNMSHNLEVQILQLFPTEKLEHYRTEKRGKIYVKFCNMKRYRRDRTVVKRKWDNTLSTLSTVRLMSSLAESRGSIKESELSEGNVNDEDFLMGFENWPYQTQVKTEDFTEDDLN